MAPLLNNRIRILRLSLAAAAVAMLLALPGTTEAGSYFPPPRDDFPLWSQDGSRVAFFTELGTRVESISVDGSDRKPLWTDFEPFSGVYEYALSPDWTWVAINRYHSGSYTLTVSRIDGSQQRSLVDTGNTTSAFGTRPTWSSDAERIAFRGADGALEVIGRDGQGLTRIATRGETPSWSPDGRWVAYTRPTAAPEIHVVRSDGQEDKLLARGPGAQLEPKWSPDGTRIAFLTQSAVAKPLRIGVVREGGSGLRTYPGPGSSNPEQFIWAPDGRAIVFARNLTQGLLRLDLATGKTQRLTQFGGTPALSPDGTHMAFSGGGECRDREGIYLANADGLGAVRATNDCRILGTGGDDVLRGTELADILIGLAGNDRLVAVDPGYMGDTLLGGDGNDLLLGAVRGEILKGGPGEDVLRGGNSGDWLYGGPGRDRLYGGRGNDFIYARDGSADLVSCGKNLVWRRSERDEVWADHSDQVSPDCEIVHWAK